MVTQQMVTRKIRQFVAIILVGATMLVCAGCQEEMVLASPEDLEFSDGLTPDLNDSKGPANSESDSALKEESHYRDTAELSAGSIVPEEEIDFDNLSRHFVSLAVSEDIQTRINGKSYRENPDISLDELRYLKVLHYNFNHEIQVGELIVNVSLDAEFLEILTELFENEYEIQSMYLIDNYWTGDAISTDSASITANNTSAFCYREITWGGELSRHAFGRAIDINPQQNPYVDYSSGSPSWAHTNANDYIDRTTGAAHVITHEDLCYKVFTNHGFEWGGDWYPVIDYQHFEKR
jgi:hypothetical protein